MKMYLITPILVASAVQAQIVVNVLPVKVVGHKAIVPIALKNNLATEVKAAKAALFIIDTRGKMVCESVGWVIGGPKSAQKIPPGATNSFNFVITSTTPLVTTNLISKVQFSRVVLADGKLADIPTDVKIYYQGTK